MKNKVGKVGFGLVVLAMLVMLCSAFVSAFDGNGGKSIIVGQSQVQKIVGSTENIASDDVIGKSAESGENSLNERTDYWDVFAMGKLMVRSVGDVGLDVDLYFSIDINFGTDLFNGKIHQLNVQVLPRRVTGDAYNWGDFYHYLCGRGTVMGLGTNKVGLSVEVYYTPTGQVGTNKYESVWEIGGGYGKPYESKVNQQTVWW
ncbi:MAG: hypothetical protein FWD76_01005 [Firmicutes bacterium]|nr:hypothetical protein [Bacillota bacterium]